MIGDSVRINGALFVDKGFPYKHDYVKVAQLVKSDEYNGKAILRKLCKTDLFFLVFFVVKPFLEQQEDTFNNKFCVARCKDIEGGDNDSTLDVWARFHFKSTIITIGETIQWILSHKETATGIFSYAKTPAEKFIVSIRNVLMSPFLISLFPDVLYKNPFKDSPMWSIDKGLIVKRKTNRGEPTVSGYGLTEGMPTGKHFERMIYDDIVTSDMSKSPDLMQTVKERFDESRNLKTLVNHHHRVVGTFYDYNDPLTYVRDILIYGTNIKRYAMRLYPATEDGTVNGKPVLMSEEALNDLKGRYGFNTQMLCDPNPEETRRLDPDDFIDIEQELIPNDCIRFMLIDPAGDSSDPKKGDSWAMILVDVEPNLDDIGLSNIYIINAFIDKATHAQAIDTAIKMYLNGGFITALGVEKVSQATAEIHICNGLKAKGRFISEDNKSLYIFKPAGRKKLDRIYNALELPLLNHKIYISKSCPSAYKDRLKSEAANLGFWHDDGLDALSYLYDILRDYRFYPKKKKEPTNSKPISAWVV